MTDTAAFAAGECGFTLSAPEPLATVLIDALDDLRVPAVAANAPVLAITAQADDTFTLRRGDVPAGTDLDAPRALHAALSMVNETVAEAWSRRNAAIHAAVVDRDGRGCAIIGYSGFGKTTLAAGAVRAGWGYVADELGLVDDHHVAHAFHRPLGLRHGGLLQLGLAPRYEELFNVVQPWRGSALGRLATSTCLTALVFLAPPSSDGAVAPMSPGAALTTLLSNVHGAAGVERDVFRRLERLVRAVPAVQMPRTNLDRMVESLEQLVTADAPSAVAPGQ